MSIDFGGWLVTFTILIVPSLTVSYIFFYTKRRIAIRNWHRRQANKEA